LKEVHIFYSKIKDQPISLDNSLFEKLPKDLLAKNKKYLRWQDRKLNVLGKLLLIEGLKLYNLDSGYLEKLKYTKYGKPYFLDLELDFNISHSGEYAICALAKGMRLGVDIEKIKEIDLDSFPEVFTQNEFHNINTSKSKEETFYNYWTIKESIIKAIGKGLSIPLQDIKINTSKQVNYNNDIWYVEGLQIDDQYASHIAIDYKEVKFNYHLIDFYKG